MTQTNWVIDKLSDIRPDWTFEIVPITTKGDRILDVTLSKVGGKGLFVSEIEQVLVAQQADLAVHSLKDVPFSLAEGLVLGGIPKREDPRDALVSHGGVHLDDLKQGAVIGTSSLRRAAQILAHRPDLKIEPLRGNVDTRLSRVRNGEFDAIVLAAAGLHRMDWAHEITEYLPADWCTPAVGQGILGVECRADDKEVLEALATFTDEETRTCATAERALLRTLEGSCQVPIAGYAEKLGDGQIRLQAMVANPLDNEVIRHTGFGTDAEALGVSVAKVLIENGAQEYLARAQRGDSPR